MLDVPAVLEAAEEYLRGRGLGDRSILDVYERLGDSGFALEQAIALPSSFSILDFRPQ